MKPDEGVTKHSDIQTVKDNLKELFSMIEYKSSDKYIQSMKQYIVNPMAWFITEDMVKQSQQQELERLREFVSFIKKHHEGRGQYNSTSNLIAKKANELLKEGE